MEETTCVLSLLGIQPGDMAAHTHSQATVVPGFCTGPWEGAAVARVVWGEILTRLMSLEGDRCRAGFRGHVGVEAGRKGDLGWWGPCEHLLNAYLEQAWLVFLGVSSRVWYSMALHPSWALAKPLRPHRQSGDRNRT